MNVLHVVVRFFLQPKAIPLTYLRKVALVNMLPLKIQKDCFESSMP